MPTAVQRTRPPTPHIHDRAYHRTLLPICGAALYLCLAHPPSFVYFLGFMDKWSRILHVLILPTFTTDPRLSTPPRLVQIFMTHSAHSAPVSAPRTACNSRRTRYILLSPHGPSVHPMPTAVCLCSVLSCTRAFPRSTSNVEYLKNPAHPTVLVPRRREALDCWTLIEHGVGASASKSGQVAALFGNTDADGRTVY